MRTAEEMYNYCLSNNFGSGLSRGWALKHFGIIESALRSDEEVRMCFIGLHNYVSPTKHDMNFAYAISTKRIIMAQKKVIGQILQTVLLDNVNDITFNAGMMWSVITIDTMKEVFNVGVTASEGKSINDQIHDVIMDMKSTPIQPVVQTVVIQQGPQYANPVQPYQYIPIPDQQYAAPVQQYAAPVTSPGMVSAPQVNPVPVAPASPVVSAPLSFQEASMKLMEYRKQYEAGLITQAQYEEIKKQLLGY